ncbi:alpha-1,3-mannosyl-glycoprotein 2-beta-N-acetylglucosaminyltransferase [Canna indica]|uniref:Alpha-1,3-mannosyl-glycoprotein 2-beta-N-acetylglucosaminyltransferase n=1 Tax=Canna indica TaxID=4628 RepID=A0AAQ3QI15_9LILI|nr:alpha-1,3-mannosyl-glycoprotein 2-beta-N-acetylglucosaminyltransferase [Canna indica]
MSLSWKYSHLVICFPFLLIHINVCSSYTSIFQGSSMGQFFNQYLEPIRLNDAHVDWKSVDLSYLTEDKFLIHFAKMVSDARPIQGADVILKEQNIDSDMRIKYNDQRHFEQIARQFGIFEEWKDGIPRTAYKGVVVFRYRGQWRIFLVGPDSLSLLGLE